MGHDQRFKEFLQLFLQDFLKLFYPETYFPLSGEVKARYDRMVARKEYRKVQDVELSWAEKLEQKGLEKGLEKGSLMAKRETLLRQLEKKFGALPEAIRQRVEAIDGPEELDSLLDRVLSAASLDEMEL